MRAASRSDFDPEFLAKAMAEMAAREAASSSLAGYTQYMTEHVPAKHHRLICDRLDRVIEGVINPDSPRAIKRLIIAAPPGSAKALALDTPILTPTGWSTMGDLKVGDQVFADDGKPCTVTWKSEIFRDRPVWKVKTDCGDEIIADDDHEWEVKIQDHCGGPRIYETKYLGEKHHHKRPRVRPSGPIQMLPDDYLIEPYVLGYWLGDGHSEGGRCTTHKEDQPWLFEEFKKLGYTVLSDHSVKSNFTVSDLRWRLSELNLLRNKHIPEEYFWGSIEQREALLQGLVDSDGYIGPSGGCKFSNTNKNLTDGVVRLVQSLGRKVFTRESIPKLYGKECRRTYTAEFYYERAARMPRKRDKCKDAQRTPFTYLEFERAPNCDTVCIEVDSPSHLFLAGRSLTITHNSTYTSLAFASYAAGKLPDRSNIIAASHTDEFSQAWGRKVRNLISSEKQAKIFPNGVVSADDRAASRWSTVGGTGYFGVGVGGSVTGRRGNILLCDDLLRGRFDADSKKRRDEIWDWFTADAYTRVVKGGAIVIIATRWHEDDLTGRLLERMANGGEHWDFLKLQAICEEPEEDPMRRNAGEALWPDFQPLDMMINIRDNSGMSARDWASLYQQNPSPEDGNMLSRTWFNKYDRAKNMEMIRTECEIFLSNDTAVKGAERNDPTVTLAFARHKNGNIYLLEELRIKEEFVGMKKKVRDFGFRILEEYGKFSMLIENKGNGSALASAMKHEVSWPIIELEPKTLGDKEFRFDRCSPIFEAGQFFVPSDADCKKWVDEYINELVTFPASKNDDRVDATSQALNYMSDRRSKKRRMRTLTGLT